MQHAFQKRLVTVMIFAFALSLSAFAQKKSADKKSSGGGAGLDKAYLQKIWDGWGSLDGSKQAEFYAKGPHMFFDVAPLKYNNFDEYSAGVNKEFADYSGAKFVLNDDTEIHSMGPEHAWVASTVKADMTRKNGKREISTMRWTAIFQKEGGKWLIVHEHVSEPVQ
jgi:ketosteroid isomerase-like protein